MKTRDMIIAAAAALCLAVGGFYAGQTAGRNELAQEQVKLQKLNRSSIQNMDVAEDTVYVIGHRSPDSDTVCSAIAYARFLNLLGYKAEPRITQAVSNETAFILQEAGGLQGTFTYIASAPARNAAVFIVIDKFDFGAAFAMGEFANGLLEQIAPR